VKIITASHEIIRARENARSASEKLARAPGTRHKGKSQENKFIVLPKSRTNKSKVTILLRSGKSFK